MILLVFDGKTCLLYPCVCVFSIVFFNLPLYFSYFLGSWSHQDLEVVNNSGTLKRARPQEIRGKRNTQSRRAFVVDSQQNQLEVQ